VYRLVDAERGDVHLDELGNLRRQTLDLDLAEDRLEDAARDDPRRLADEAEGHRHRQALGQVDLVEVGVQHLAADGVALHLAQQDHLVVQLSIRPTTMDEPDQVGTFQVLQLFVELLRLHPDRDRRAFGAVEHGGDHTGAAEFAGRALAALGAAIDVNFDCFHGGRP